jgi:hypothetical protein
VGLKASGLLGFLGALGFLSRGCDCIKKLKIEATATTMKARFKNKKT